MCGRASSEAFQYVMVKTIVIFINTTGRQRFTELDNFGSLQDDFGCFPVILVDFGWENMQIHVFPSNSLM